MATYMRELEGGEPQAPHRGSEDEPEYHPRRGESAERPEAAPDVVEGGRERGSVPPGTPPPMREKRKIRKRR